MAFCLLTFLSSIFIVIAQKETHFGNITQLTFGGQNAEAYWSIDGKMLTMQATRPGYECDQIFRLENLQDPKNQILTSTGKGRTTCSYWTNDNKHIIYSSTHLHDDKCPTPPPPDKGYVWGLYNYDIFQVNVETGELVQLTNTLGYNAESTICRVDGSIMFTSTRDGDLELYRMDADGSNVKRLTFIPGYDGGAYFSTDCTKIVWRASRPKGKDLEDYYKNLKEGYVSPLQLELFVANADGSNARQVTNLNVASFAPYLFPDAKRIIFSSNYNNTDFFFNLWAINVDGTNLEQITFNSFFNSFPMFTPDGKTLAFCSARNGHSNEELNAFVVDWLN